MAENACECECAGIYRRLAAFVIDKAILGILATVLIFLSLVFAGPLGQEGSVSEEEVMWAFATRSVLWFLFSPISIAYYLSMESTDYRGTLGKIIVGIRIAYINEDDNRFGATSRYLSKYLSVASFGLGYAIIFFSKRRRCLHDYLAGTIVIKSS
ncbi:MAG: RDD family protein [Phycisphaerales bacterium]|nr:RDD family protein [Phycisphaerales bacterium]